MSFPALLGILSYCVTALACGLAWRASRRGFWLGLGGVFLALVAWRFAGAEDLLRDGLRTQLATRDLYAGRRAIQGVIAGLVLLAGAGVGAWLWRRRSRPGARQRAQGWAELALAGLGGLILLRLISFSPIDRLLYGGPVHLNWFLEGGLVAVCAMAAFSVWRRHV